LHEVRVRERRAQPRFAPKRLFELGIAGDVLAKPLDRDRTREAAVGAVGRAEDLADPARAERLAQHVLAEKILRANLADRARGLLHEIACEQRASDAGSEHEEGAHSEIDDLVAAS